MVSSPSKTFCFISVFRQTPSSFLSYSGNHQRFSVAIWPHGPASQHLSELNCCPMYLLDFPSEHHTLTSEPWTCSHIPSGRNISLVDFRPLHKWVSIWETFPPHHSLHFLQPGLFFDVTLYSVWFTAYITYLSACFLCLPLQCMLHKSTCLSVLFDWYILLE